jgi:hypothetical protein
LIHKDIESLRIDFQESALHIIEKFRQKSVSYSILETFREQGIQNCYYAQGREPLNVVNNLRKENGLYLLSESENKRIITQTKTSNHTKGIAIDIVPIYKSGKVIWDYNNPVWLQISTIAKELKDEVSWGGFWTSFIDMPHWEMI